MRVYLLFLVFLVSCGRGPSYIKSETVNLPTNGQEVATTGALDPAVMYRIRISSRSNLADIQSLLFRELNGRWIHDEDADILSAAFLSGVVLDGEPRRVTSYNNRDYVTALYFLYRGKGRPLRIKTFSDYSQDIQSAQVDIYPAYWWVKWVTGLSVLCAVALLAWYIDTQPARERTRQERLRQAEQAWQASQREFQRLQEQRERERAERERQKELARQERERQKEYEQKERALQQRVKAAQQARAEQERQAKEERANAEKRAERILSLRLQAQVQSDLLDPAVRESYAQAKYREILDDHQAKWLAEYQAIMRDTPLLDELRRQAPDVLAWWEAKIELIRLAERCALTRSATSATRTKPTPEEWREKAVKYSQVQAEDEAAKFFAALEGELKVREAVKAKEQEILQRTDLSEEEKQEYLRIVRDMAAARLHAMHDRKSPGDNDEEQDAKILH